MSRPKRKHRPGPNFSGPLAAPRTHRVPPAEPAARLPTFPRSVHVAAAIGALILGAAAGVYRQCPTPREGANAAAGAARGLDAFLSPYVCNDDARQQLYWMASFHDQTLFQNDIVVDYARHYVSPGVKALYWLLTFGWPPILAGKLTACALMALGAYWCFRIGERLSGLAAGVSAAVLFATLTPIADRIVGGNPRAFMYPLLAAWLCCLVQQEHVKTAVVAVISALTYPMAFMLCVPAWLLDAVRFEGGRPVLDRARSRWMATLAGVLLGGAVLGAKYLSPDDRFGPIADRARVMSDPAFREGGRFSEVLGDGGEGFLTDWVRAAGTPFGLRGRWDGESWVAGNPKWSGWFVGGLLALWVALAAARLVPMPRQFVYLALASMVMYGVAWLVVFRLFVPARYVQFSFSLLAMLGMAMIFSAMSEHIAAPAARRVAGVVAMAIAAGISFGLSYVRPAVPHINQAHNAAIWQTIERVVPPDAVIAGPPTYLDSVGAFSKRKTYMPDELAHPAYTTYYDNVVTPRIRRTFAVLFAETPDEVLRFAREEKVDYLFYNATEIERGSLTYIKPFDEQLSQLKSRGGPRVLGRPIEASRNLLGTGGKSALRLIRISPGPENAFGVAE